jgi:hypothetical protein
VVARGRSREGRKEEEWMGVGIGVGVDFGMEHEHGAWSMEHGAWSMSMDAHGHVAWRMRFGPFLFFFVYSPSVERCEAGPRHASNQASFGVLCISDMTYTSVPRPC